MVRKKYLAQIYVENCHKIRWLLDVWILLELEIWLWKTADETQRNFFIYLPLLLQFTGIHFPQTKERPNDEIHFKLLLFS